jgi:transglutaminase-like putative cysteine protease
MGTTYRVDHDTKYVYATPVVTSQHVAYLRPRALPYQHVHRHELRVEPAPANGVKRVDYFGNQVDQFQILRPHSRLLVSSESIVEVLDRAAEDDLTQSSRWEDVARSLTMAATAIPVDVPQFAQPSPYVPDSCEMAAFARASFPSGRPLLDGAIDLMHRIHDGFEFDPQATTMTTPLIRVLEERRGVCQDFAHIAVGCLRAIGLAARYVSGYLLTDPPPGQPRLVGADASHAWVGVYCPQQGWIDLDPTNDVVVGTRHVTIAWGRDYGDVSPLRGVLLGGAEHTLHVGVSVTPLP